MKHICVASMTKPTDVKAFFASIKQAIPECTAAVFAPGYGCNNYGFSLDINNEAEAESVANQLTMALMPARWSDAEGDPLLVQGKYYDATVELAKWVAIQEWYIQAGSNSEFIVAEQVNARLNGAPLDAIFQSDTKECGWVCVSDLSPEHPFIERYNEAMIKASHKEPA